MEPREWWINEITNTVVKSENEAAKAIRSKRYLGYPGGFWRVIEYSAYEKLQAENYNLRIELDQLKSTTQNTFNHWRMAENKLAAALEHADRLAEAHEKTALPFVGNDEIDFSYTARAVRAQERSWEALQDHRKFKEDMLK